MGRKRLPKFSISILTLAEEQVIACAARGVMWDAKGLPDVWPMTADQEKSRIIRSEVLTELVTGFTVEGSPTPWPVHPRGLKIRGARIVGRLDMDGAALRCRLALHQCTFEDLVSFRDSETKTVNFAGAYFMKGLDAQRAKIRGALTLGRGLYSVGLVNLIGCSIENAFDCDGGTFVNKGGIALDARAITVGSSIFLGEGFEAVGFVDLIRAQIGGVLNCSNGRFSNEGGIALAASDASIRSGVLLREGFSTNGSVEFARMQTAGDFICSAASFSNPSAVALDLTLCSMNGALVIGDSENFRAACEFNGRLDLSQASCRVYRDDERSWPKSNNLIVDGFTFDRLGSSPTSWRKRVKWLRLQIGDHLGASFRPQPWSHLSNVLRMMGYEGDAREISVQREKARMNSLPLISLERVYLKLLQGTLGFGYKPQYMMYWMVGIFFVGWCTFATAADLGFMGPRDASVQTYLAGTTNAKLPEHYSRFNALIYTMDSLLPVVELGQGSTWEPVDIQTGHRRLTTDGWPVEAVRLALGHDWTITGKPEKPAKAPATFFDYQAIWAYKLLTLGVHRLIHWTIELAGWVLASLAVAGITSVMKSR